MMFLHNYCYNINLKLHKTLLTELDDKRLGSCRIAEYRNTQCYAMCYTKYVLGMLSLDLHWTNICRVCCIFLYPHIILNVSTFILKLYYKII